MVVSVELPLTVSSPTAEVEETPVRLTVTFAVTEVVTLPKLAVAATPLTTATLSNLVSTVTEVTAPVADTPVTDTGVSRDTDTEVTFINSSL